MERAFRPLSLLMPRRGGAQSASFIARRIAPSEITQAFTWPRAQPGKGLIIIRGGVAALRGLLARRPRARKLQAFYRWSAVRRVPVAGGTVAPSRRRRARKLQAFYRSPLKRCHA